MECFSSAKLRVGLVNLTLIWKVNNNNLVVTSPHSLAEPMFHLWTSCPFLTSKLCTLVLEGGKKREISQKRSVEGKSWLIVGWGAKSPL